MTAILLYCINIILFLLLTIVFYRIGRRVKIASLFGWCIPYLFLSYFILVPLGDLLRTVFIKMGIDAKLDVHGNAVYIIFPLLFCFVMAFVIIAILVYGKLKKPASR